MSYHAIIKTGIEHALLEKIILPEQQAAKNSRACWKIEEKDGCACFNVSAEDATALRAALNSITKLLSVYEKMEKIK